MSVPLRRSERKACGMAAGAAVKTMAASTPRGGRGFRTGGTREGEFLFGGVGDDGAQSLMEGELERQMAEAAEAEEGDGLAGREGGFAESAVGGPTGAAERSGIGGGEFGGRARGRERGPWRNRRARPGGCSRSWFVWGRSARGRRRTTRRFRRWRRGR